MDGCMNFQRCAEAPILYKNIFQLEKQKFIDGCMIFQWNLPEMCSGTIIAQGDLPAAS